MVIGKVIGEIVSSVKVDRLQGQKFLLVEVQQMSREGGVGSLKSTGTTLVVNDPLGAGRDEIVLVVQGSSARMTDLTQTLPTDGLIIGIVDTVAVHGGTVYRKDDERG